LQTLSPCGSLFDELRASFAKLLSDRSAQFLHLFTQARQVLHVIFAALDFLSRITRSNRSRSLEQLQGKIQIGARDEAGSTLSKLSEVDRYKDGKKDTDRGRGRKTRDRKPKVDISMIPRRMFSSNGSGPLLTREQESKYSYELKTPKRWCRSTLVDSASSRARLSGSCPEVGSRTRTVRPA